MTLRTVCSSSDSTGDTSDEGAIALPVQVVTQPCTAGSAAPAPAVPAAVAVPATSPATATNRAVLDFTTDRDTGTHRPWTERGRRQGGCRRPRVLHRNQVQALPFTEKLDGEVSLPVQVPWNPNCTLPPGAIAAL